MDVSPAKRSYFTCANVWWKLLFHSTPPKALEKIIIYLYSPYTRNKKEMPVIYWYLFFSTIILYDRACLPCRRLGWVDATQLFLCLNRQPSIRLCFHLQTHFFIQCNVILNEKIIWYHNKSYIILFLYVHIIPTIMIVM